jgi:hypothetical protein
MESIVLGPIIAPGGRSGGAETPVGKRRLAERGGSGIVGAMQSLEVKVRKLVSAAVAALGLCIATGALAQSTVQPAPAPTDGGPAVVTEGARKTAADEVVCKREETTGSRLGAKKVCRTAAEWAEIQRAAKEETQRSQMRSTMGTESGK